MSTDWSPAAVFSPSKAREQIAQAKDWSRVEAWLASKFGGELPRSFERNPDTLKTLLSLASFNEAADEDRLLFQKVQAKASDELKQELQEDLDMDVIDALKENLTSEGEASLSCITSLAVALKSTSCEPHELGLRIHDLTKTEFDLEQQLARIAALQDQLDKETARLKDLMAELKSETFSTPSLPQKTVEWTRNTKLLQTKLLDYHERLESLSSELPPSPTIPEIVGKEQDLKKLQQHVRKLEEQVRSYQGLPHDGELAKLELESLNREYMRLVSRRDQLFEGLVEGRG